jgi:hypothetical protein
MSMKKIFSLPKPVYFLLLLCNIIFAVWLKFNYGSFFGWTSHHFEDIQNQIIEQIKSAKYSIWVAVAWFTDKTLFDLLIIKKQEGLNIQIIVINDDINKNYGQPYEKYFETYRVNPTGKYQTGVPVQKFKLPLSFGQSFLNNQNTINNGGFLNFFKGLYFKPSNDFQTSGNGAILTFNLVNSEAPSKITLYFHNDTSTVTQKFEMLINSDCSRINFFKHDRNGVPSINNQFADTTQGKTQLFIQNMDL